MIGSIEALVALDRRCFHTCNADAYRAFQRWTDWCEVGGDLSDDDRLLMATTVPALRASATGEQADILDVWASMLRKTNAA